LIIIVAVKEARQAGEDQAQHPDRNGLDDAARRFIRNYEFDVTEFFCAP